MNYIYYSLSPREMTTRNNITINFLTWLDRFSIELPLHLEVGVVLRLDPGINVIKHFSLRR
jgi:hypothetical protein